MATPFFAILVGVAAGFAHHHAARLWKPGAHVLAGAALVAVAGLYAWQTVHQTQPFLRDTDRWQVLADDLRANYDRVPPGATVYVIDDEGEWSNPYWQPTWLASVGRALYGKDVAVRALPASDFAQLEKSLNGPVYLVQLEDGHLLKATPASANRQGGQ
jgi:hypothetical protein